MGLALLALTEAVRVGGGLLLLLTKFSCLGLRTNLGLINLVGEFGELSFFPRISGTTTETGVVGTSTGRIGGSVSSISSMSSSSSVVPPAFPELALTL